VRIGGARAIRKALLQLAEVVDGVVVVALQQVHVAGRKQRLLQPRACGSKLPQFVERPLHGLFIARGTRGLTQQVKALGFGVARSALPWPVRIWRASWLLPLFSSASRERQLHLGTLRRSDLILIQESR
jgi:hypothetical protein